MRGALTMDKKERAKQEKEILELAKESGLHTNYFFVTTFERYKRLLSHLDGLQACIDDVGQMTVKEYVKGRENIVVNPAINAYNNTTSQANRTAETLLKIINGFKDKDNKGSTDPLADALMDGDSE